MSTVECYDLHVYCDFPDCKEGEFKFHPAFIQCVGRNRREATKEAQRQGWKIVDDREGILHGGRYALCPTHAKESS